MTYNLLRTKRKNGKTFNIVKSFNLEIDVLNYLQENNIKVLPNPYIFTHLNLDNGEKIKAEYNGFICSPEKLSEILKTNGFYNIELKGGLKE